MSTYSDFEESTHDGRPVELFRFAHGTTVWTYSSGPEMDHGGETYLAFPIGREGMAQTKELHKSSLEVVLPRTCEISLLFLAGNPEAVVTLTVFRAHVGASDGPIVYWKGRVVSVEWPDPATAKLSCESVFTSLKRPGLRARYQRMCRHALYSTQCGVDKAAYAVTGTVVDVTNSGRNIEVAEAAAQDDGWFTGGMVQTPSGGYLFIVGHSGETVSLANPCILEQDDEVVLYPGCARSREACSEKFDNILNFGGWPWIPLRNPFDGRSIV